jgi:hypothetical protein
MLGRNSTTVQTGMIAVEAISVQTKTVIEITAVDVSFVSTFVLTTSGKDAV